MSALTIQTVCDAVLTDVTTHVPALADAVLHRYAPWAPEEMYAAVGERHLACWPVAERAETRMVLSSDAHELEGVYELACWEEAGDAQSRRVSNEAADLEFLQSWQDSRDRFYNQLGNQYLGNTERTWYVASQLAGSSGLVRFWVLQFSTRMTKGFI